MQFILIDQITELELGKRVQAVKVLSLAEDYLQDHFPRFPVMPGVLMLEAMFQASAALVYFSEDFSNSIVLLKETRNVRYADFVQPGNSLVVSAEIQKQNESTTTLKAQATIDGSVAVSGRLILERFNLAARYPETYVNGSDVYTREKMRKRLSLLMTAEAGVSSVARSNG